jgi:hypothetical protein
VDQVDLTADFATSQVSPRYGIGREPAIPD